MGAQAYRFSTIGDVGNKGASGHDVRAYGAADDGSTDAEPEIATAITAAAGGIVVFSEAATSYKISSNVTIPSGTTVVFQEGGMLSIDNGITFTVNQGATLQAGHYQIFSGAGTAVFGKGTVEAVIPQWWGATGDDSTDNITAFESALTATANIGRMDIPPGTYQITTPLENFPSSLDNDFSTGYIIQGAGPADTIIKYTGVSDYAIKLWDSDDEDNASNPTVSYVTLRDMRIQVPNTGALGGGGIEMLGNHFSTIENIHFDDIDASNGTCIRVRRRPYIATEDSFTNDTNRDFTTSGGGGATEAYAIAWTTGGVTAGTLKGVTVRLGKTGSPAGTITATLYSDSSGPSAAVDGASATVTNNNLSSAADGADQEFTFAWADRATLSPSTKYWIVLETSGYTYADGVTEVRLRVEAGAGAANTFATFDDGGSSWSTSNDGANHVEEVGRVQAIWNYIRRIEANNNSGEFYRGIEIQDDSQVTISDCSIAGKTALVAPDGGAFILARYCNFDSNDASSKVIDFSGGSGRFSAMQCYAEGSSTSVPADFGNFQAELFGCIFGIFAEWDVASQVNIVGGVGPWVNSSDPEMQPKYDFRYMVYTPNRPDNTRSILLRNTATTAVDADALTGTAWSFPATNDGIDYEVGDTITLDQYWLTEGTYLLTVYAKATTPDGTDLNIVTKETGAGGAVVANEVYALTTDYLPYHIVLPWTFQEDKYTRLISLNVNGVFISHFELRYMGPANPHQRDIIAFNTEAGDADGDRASRLAFQGIQSGDEQSFLAEITASHDGAADDEKGKFAIAVNDGNDSFAPTDRFTIDSAGKIQLVGDVVANTYNFAADAEASDTYVITLSPAPSAYTTGMTITFTANTANTGACTVNVNALGAKSLKSLHDQDPPDNYIESGSVVMATYDGTNFQMIQPDANP
jgi:hypothetical protein